MLNKIRRWWDKHTTPHFSDADRHIMCHWEMLRDVDGSMHFRSVDFINRVVILRADGTIELSDALREVQLIERLAGLND